MNKTYENSISRGTAANDRPEPSQEEKIRMMRLAEKYMENSNEFWSKEDNERLTRMFYEGKGVSEMALELGRSERTVMHQLNVLKLYGYKNSRRTRDDDGICLCNRCQKYAACELRKLAGPSQPVPCMQQ